MDKRSMDGIEVVKQEIKEIDTKLNDHLMQCFYLLSAHPMFSTTPSPVDVHTGQTPIPLFKGRNVFTSESNSLRK